MKRFSFPQILAIVLASFASLAILLVLGAWTLKIKQESDEKALRKAMERVVDAGGAEALFKMAGIPTDQIYYGSELIPIYQNDDGAWNYTASEARNIAVYSKCRDSVVQIIPESDLSDKSQGSGIIIGSDGYIVTNLHVVGTAESFAIIFSDDVRSSAVLVGSDSLTDIAVLKAQRTNLKPIEMGSSSSLSVGQALLAIGNPFGYTWSFTSGMVSGLERMVSASNQGSLIPNMIQTDALINPGNSGGPLLDTEGKMVGLVSSIYSTQGTAQGISFALPVETVRDVADAIISDGKVSRGWLDVISVELNAQIVDYCGLSVDKGILVSQTVPLGKADRGGIRGGNEKAQYGNSVIYLNGDVIVAINGKKIESYSDYFASLFSTKAGDKADVTVFRKGQIVLLKGIELIEQTEENSRWILR